MRKIILLLLVSSIVYATFFTEKDRLDREVERLCAIDGGIKVYETVKLPAEKFVRYTQNITTLPYRILRDDDEYYRIWEVSYLRSGNPSISRDHFQIIRQSDSKILGESISYVRIGGDIPGPWHGSSFRCPETPNLARHVFIQTNGE